MYTSRMLEIGKVENGFVVECRVPLKPKAKSTTKMDSCCVPCGPGSCEKQYIAKTAKEVGELIEDLMPLLEAEYTSEKEFDSAFNQAAQGAMKEEGNGD